VGMRVGLALGAALLLAGCATEGERGAGSRLTGPAVALPDRAQDAEAALTRAGSAGRPAVAGQTQGTPADAELDRRERMLTAPRPPAGPPLHAAPNRVAGEGQWSAPALPTTDPRAR
jgi:hypothetical protein